MTTHRGTVPIAQWPDLRRKRSLATRKDWGQHRSVMRFLERYFPTEWDKIRTCRLDFKPREETSNPGYVKAVPSYVCERIPYCIQCTKANTQRRVWDTLNKFALATPRGQPLRLIHIVQTAPLVDGRGWGLEASQDHHAFGAVVWQALVEHFGTGIGAYMSYQDFGEKPFIKRHPHKDLTLNGWRLDDNNRPAKTPYLDLRKGGRARWDETIRRLAMDFRDDATRGSLHLGRPVEGHVAYYKYLAYQVRELVNFRNVRYDADKDVVKWWDYHLRLYHPIPAETFLDGLIEYQKRLGVWARTEHFKQLHTSHGHLSKKLMRQTQRAFGGDEIPHGEDCPCGECGDWHAVFLDEPGRSYEDVRPLSFEDDP